MEKYICTERRGKSWMIFFWFVLYLNQAVYICYIYNQLIKNTKIVNHFVALLSNLGVLLSCSVEDW